MVPGLPDGGKSQFVSGANRPQLQNEVSAGCTSCACAPEPLRYVDRLPQPFSGEFRLSVAPPLDAALHDGPHLAWRPVLRRCQQLATGLDRPGHLPARGWAMRGHLEDPADREVVQQVPPLATASAANLSSLKVCPLSRVAVGYFAVRLSITSPAGRSASVALAALAATNLLQTGEGQSLSQAVGGVESTFHISDALVAWIPTAMIVLGVAGSFGVGVLADRRRRTTLVAVATVVWTVCMGLSGLAVSFATLFLARSLVGAMESTGPASVSLISDYFPVTVRARSMGLWLAGSIPGSLIGLVGGGLLVGALGWRWAFWMWVPLGVAVAAWLAGLPEPTRGVQDAQWADAVREQAGPAFTARPASPARAEPCLIAAPSAPFSPAAPLPPLTPILPPPPSWRAGALPPPRRVSTLDYKAANLRAAFRELARVPTLWCALSGLTVSGLLLNTLAFWGVPYFERTFALAPAQAGAVAASVALGAVVGLPGGGVVTDRLYRRGLLRAGVYVAACATIASGIVFSAAFVSRSLLLAAPLLFAGGLLLAAAIGPGEALLCDVVVAGLRGRAGIVRAAVRSLAAVGPPLTGLLADHVGLRVALALTTPAAVLGGAVVLLGAWWYPTDVAFVAAEAHRCEPTV